MKPSNTLSACGRDVARFFQCALAILLLSVSTATMAVEKINLNTADAQALQYIPNIGTAKADAIILFREQFGDFKHMQELLSVQGIGEKILLDLKKFGALDSGVSTLSEEMQENRPHKAAANQHTQAEQTVANN